MTTRRALRPGLFLSARGDSPALAPVASRHAPAVALRRRVSALVGPRPERPKFVRELSEKVEDYSGRLQVKPGLTGLAQVENGYDSSVSTVTTKVRFDLQYIRSWSIFSDIRIILKTFVVVFTGRGAC